MSSFTILLITTSLNDVPIFQVIPPAIPHPDIHQYAWVLDYTLGHPHLTLGSDLYLWYPHHNRFMSARISMPFHIHEGYVFHFLDSAAFVVPQAIAIPLHHYHLAPPPDLTAL